MTTVHEASDNIYIREINTKKKKKKNRKDYSNTSIYLVNVTIQYCQAISKEYKKTSKQS